MAFIEVRNRTKNAASDGFACIKSNALSRRIQIARVRNIGNVLEYSGLSFRLDPPYGGLLVKYTMMTENPNTIENQVNETLTNPQLVLHTFGIFLVGLPTIC